MTDRIKKTYRTVKVAGVEVRRQVVEVVPDAKSKSEPKTDSEAGVVQIKPKTRAAAKRPSSAPRRVKR